MFLEQNFGPVRIIPGPNKGRYPYCHSVYIEGAGVRPGPQVLLEHSVPVLHWQLIAAELDHLAAGPRADVCFPASDNPRGPFA